MQRHLQETIFQAELVVERDAWPLAEADVAHAGWMLSLSIPPPPFLGLAPPSSQEMAFLQVWGSSLFSGY